MPMDAMRIVPLVLALAVCLAALVGCQSSTASPPIPRGQLSHARRLGLTPVIPLAPSSLDRFMMAHDAGTRPPVLP